MMSCEESRGLLHAYVDGELSASESLALEAHIVDCASCAAEYRELRLVVDTVRGATPIYEAPPGGRSKIESLLVRHRRRRLLGRLAWGIAGCVLLVSLALVQRAGSAGPFEEFAEMAADVHRRYASGALALDLRSEDGPAVSAWLGERLPFQITLPRYPTQPGAEKRYTLVGARLLPFDHHSLAYVAYMMKGEPISLLITSSALVAPTGGQVYHSGGLKFHFLSRNGQRLIAWSDRGLSYALVSSVQASGAASCVVCHGGETERPKFEKLVPSTH